jgi:cytochrome c
MKNKNIFLRVLRLTILALLSSCGGGGTTNNDPGPRSSVDEATPAPVNTEPLSITKYAGHYEGGCSLLTGASNYETGEPLYLHSYLSVAPSSSTQAQFSYRFEFYTNATCSGSAAGFVSNTSPASVVSVVDAIETNGVLSDAVKINTTTPQGSFSSSGTSGVVIYGGAMRLALPDDLTQRYVYNDLWFIKGDQLFFGTADYANDGFPVGLNLNEYFQKIPVLPPEPALPCGRTDRAWSAGEAACTASMPPTLSGLVGTATNTTAPAVGSATFSCSNGVWSAPTQATCVIPPPTVCSEQTLTWTIEGASCFAPVPRTPIGEFIRAGDADGGTVEPTGQKLFRCVQGGIWESWAEFEGTATCSVYKPPVYATPLELAQAKNCLACHRVLGEFVPGSFPSFEAVANYYRNNPPAPGVLESKIYYGGVGTFGSIPMPANSQASDADLAILVPWILSQPK